MSPTITNTASGQRCSISARDDKTTSVLLLRPLLLSVRGVVAAETSMNSRWTSAAAASAIVEHTAEQCEDQLRQAAVASAAMGFARRQTSSMAATLSVTAGAVPMRCLLVVALRQATAREHSATRSEDSRATC